jgi:hypothetical protein
LTSAVERGASPDEALALLDRLDRLAPAGDAVESPRDAKQRRRQMGGLLAADRNGARAVTLLLVLALGIAAGVLVMIYWSTAASPWPVNRTRAALAPRPIEDPLPVPVAAEVALARASTLYAKGRLRDALSVLERIRPGDPLRPRADELRIEIQHHLLEASRSAPPPSPAASPAR